MLSAAPPARGTPPRNRTPIHCLEGSRAVRCTSSACVPPKRIELLTPRLKVEYSTIELRGRTVRRRRRG